MNTAWDGIRTSAIKGLEQWIGHSATLQMLIEDAVVLLEATDDAREFMDKFNDDIVSKAPELLRPQVMGVVMACVFGADVTLDEEETSK